MTHDCQPDRSLASNRDAAMAYAARYLDDGSFEKELAHLISIPSESQIPMRALDLKRYLDEGISPILKRLGFSLHQIETAEDINDVHALPTLLATRIEDPNLPTVLLYGHGDVVNGMETQWRKGLNPWVLTREGDKIYGRGVVDNKGQHLIAFSSLAAVIKAKGRLGFNVKILMDMGEEIGSPGLRKFLSIHRSACSADVFLAFDGPRLTEGGPEINLGARGLVNLELIVNLRSGTHHSGHWGGLLADPAIILAHALTSIMSREGHVLVPGWTPTSIPEAVRAKCAELSLPNHIHPEAEVWWGEASLTPAERIFAWTSPVVLSLLSGTHETPVNAVQGDARARLGIRHTIDVPARNFAPFLREHLVREGHVHVQVHEIVDRDIFAPARTPPDNLWVRRVAASMERTSGATTNVIPNNSASNPSSLFQDELSVPTIWIPWSHPGCGQHGPDEHALLPLFREGLQITAGLWWDLGDPAFLEDFQ